MKKGIIFCFLLLRLVLIAGDISPIDVISHLPVLCEENKIPYVFVPAKSDLGAAAGTKRPTSCIMFKIPDSAEYKEKYDEVLKKLKSKDE